MKYYNGYPIIDGHVESKSRLVADKCPYCGRTEHHYYTKYTANPTRRMSHCLKLEACDYYYINIVNLKGGEENGSKSNV